jgi:hypothetical protein
MRIEKHGSRATSIKLEFPQYDGPIQLNLIQFELAQREPQ